MKINKPALALAAVGASFALLQAFGPATARGDGVYQPRTPLAAAAAPAPRASASGVHFSSLAAAGDVRPQRSGLPVAGGRGLAGLAGASLDDITVSNGPGAFRAIGDSDRDVADLAADAALRRLTAADAWATAGGGTAPTLGGGGNAPLTYADAAAANWPAAEDAVAAGSAPGLPAPALAVGTVPEPTTWAMLLAGMALVGVNLRRRGPRDVLA